MDRDIPVWLQKGRALRQYPWQDGDVRTEVCVIGGGVTGTLCALRLVREGRSVVLLTQHPIGRGMTSQLMPASLCDGGQNLRVFARRVGRETVFELLRLSFQAADELEVLCGEFCGEAGFARRDSIVYADSDADADQLHRDCAEYRREGFDCIEMNRAAFGSAFAFPACGAMVMGGGAVEIDPYLLAQHAAALAADEGAIIFENTRAERISTGEADKMTVTTSTHRTVTADRVVIAAGGACGEILAGIVPGHTRYIAASRPVRAFDGWPGRCVVRSYGQPGIICCSSPDERLVISSTASASDSNRERLRGALHIPSPTHRRYAELEEAARYLFPGVGASRFDSEWTLRGIRTTDGLPIVGRTRAQPGCIFAASGGDGGVLTSVLLSRVVVDVAADREPEELRIFSPGRRRLAG